MWSRCWKRLPLVAGAFLAAFAISASAGAASMHQGSNGSSGTVTSSIPGPVLWTYYQTVQMGQLCPPNTDPNAPCNTGSNSDNLIRLVNPNGAGNANLAGAKAQTVCAMIYVFDDDEEMGECCGCPISSTGLATFSVMYNLTANWALQNGSEQGNIFDPSNGMGAIAIVAAAPNATFPSNCFGLDKACHGGCDPTNVPGYNVTSVNNLLGSITHNQMVAGNPLDGQAHFGINEVGLSDDAGGDPTNLVYLQNQCGALIGNSSGAGVCSCPTE